MTLIKQRSPLKPVDKEMVVVVGQGGYLAHQMCEDHVCRNAAKLRILNTNHRTHITTISPTPKGGLTTVPILSWRGPSVAKGPPVWMHCGIGAGVGLDEFPHAIRLL